MSIKLTSIFSTTITLVVGAIAFSSCSQAQGPPDFNEIGKQSSLLLQNHHYNRQAFSDKYSNEVLDTYLRILDPNKVFFTQADVDQIRQQFGTELDDYLLSSTMMNVADVLYRAYMTRAKQRLSFAKDLVQNSFFTFDRNKYIERSRRKSEWTKDENEINRLWRDMVEEQVLAEQIRRDTATELAQEQNKPDPNAKEKPPREKIMMRYERLLRNLEESDTEDIGSALLNAAALTYDPHTEYMSARATERFTTMIDASLIGIGAQLLSEDDGTTKVNGIVTGGPAEKSGELKLNDKILAVDTDNSGNMVDITYMKIDKVVSIVRGKEGTIVNLKIEPADTPGQTKVIAIKRQRVEMKDELAQAKLIDSKGPNGSRIKFGIITLPSFYADTKGGARKCAADMEKVLKRLVQEGAQGIIIDLRNNGGGSLEEVRRMTGFFTGGGPVVQIKDARGNIDIKSANAGKPLYDGPIVVIINKLSASASEILAGALQDYGRAIIVGDTSTYGKGTVQQPIEIGRFLPYFSSREKAGMLKITTQKFYRVTGASTQHRGVNSDIVLPSLTAAFPDLGEAYRDHVMPYDEIPPAKGYKKDITLDSFLPQLRESSEQRVAKDTDLQVVRDDIERMKKRTTENKLSLNKDERTAESTELAQRRKTINAERKKRYELLAKKDAKNYVIYDITIDNADEAALQIASKETKKDKNLKVSDDAEEKLNDTPDTPSGLDAETRECINILMDLIKLTNNKLPLN